MHEISVEWAAQRIKGLSLFQAVWNALRPKVGPASQRDYRDADSTHLNIRGWGLE